MKSNSFSSTGQIRLFCIFEDNVCVYMFMKRLFYFDMFRGL